MRTEDSVDNTSEFTKQQLLYISLAVFALVEILQVITIFLVDFYHNMSHFKVSEWKYANQAFGAIAEGDLNKLKKHPLVQYGVKKDHSEYVDSSGK